MAPIHTALYLVVGVLPGCVTVRVTVFALSVVLNVTVALRLLVDVFALADSVTLLLPLPLVGLAVSQLALLLTVQFVLLVTDTVKLVALDVDSV